MTVLTISTAYRTVQRVSVRDQIVSTIFLTASVRQFLQYLEFPLQFLRDSSYSI